MCAQTVETEVLIIGGGLSGLHTAFALQQQSRPFVLLEARERLGGRVLSVVPDTTSSGNPAGFDLGPAWFWPGQQRMLSLIEQLGLNQEIFEQHAEGDVMFEDQSGKAQRFNGGITMAGSYRLHGGLGSLVDKLSTHLTADSVIKSATVTAISKQSDHILTSAECRGNVVTIQSSKVVLALPPRVAMANIHFSPPLSENRTQQLNRVATWMAAQAKIVALYDEPFWRNKGLSGDAMSHIGPMHEIHDASPSDGGPYALFGFIGVPVGQREGKGDAIKTAAIEQLTRLFGEQAKKKQHIYFRDWAFDAETTVELDHAPLGHHPENQPGELLEAGWEKSLIWSGTETATTHTGNNGYLEGALEASERSVNFLN